MSCTSSPSRAEEIAPSSSSDTTGKRAPGEAEDHHDGPRDRSPRARVKPRAQSAPMLRCSAERFQKVRPMTWEQRDAFLAAAAPETRYATLFAVLAKAGLR